MIFLYKLRAYLDYINALKYEVNMDLNMDFN